jgi:single-stranded-DNA-specific exonuclease
MERTARLRRGPVRPSIVMAAVAETGVSWSVGTRDAAKEQRLQKELGIPALVSAILVRRGYDDPERAHKFLHPSLDQLHAPSLLPDYEVAVAEILGAKERGERIFIHGDYDVDGVTSAALFSRFLRTIGCDVITHVPHRMKEGYGIHVSAVDEAHAQGAKLFLTCDCGIGAVEQVDRAIELGMRVVVTDHHSIGETLPKAHALVNPHRKGSLYPFPEISGVGVAFKICAGITQELGYSPQHFYRAFLDLAALGTVADVMPLVDENRVIAKFGLEQIKESKKVGIQALLRESEVFQKTDHLRAWHIGFVLGPRLNAAGRIDDAALALRLLLEEDEHQAALLARKIEEINTKRRQEQERIVEEAVEIVESEGLDQRHVIVVARKGWHPGVIGIVAGRLVEQFRRPAFVASIDGETGDCKGSARTIPGFHLADAIRAHPELIQGGGHAMAAGFSLHVERLDELARTLHDYAGEFLTPEDFTLKLEADLEVEPDEVTLGAVEQLAMLEPFGCDNPEPLLLARSMTFAQVAPTKNPEHAQVSLRKGEGRFIKGIAFGQGERLAQFEPGFVADVLFKPQVELWNGSSFLKWHVKDFMPTAAISLQ